MKRRTGRWLKAAVAVALAAALATRIPWGEVAGAVRRISAGAVAQLLGLAVAMTVVSCLKWQLLLRARGTRVGLGRLVRLYTVGYFFNYFLPGSMGGDVVRSYALGRSIRSQADSFGTVFLERFTGFFAMIGLALAAAAARPSVARTPHMGGFLAAMALVFAGMALFLWLAPLQRGLLRLLDRFPDAGLWRKLRRFLEVVFHFRKRPGPLAVALLLSVAFHALTVVNTAVACRAIAAPARFLDLAVAVPMVLLVSSVPISLNAIGLMEGAFVFFLGRAGVGPAEAMTVALIMRAKNVLMALVGGGFFAADRGRADAAAERPLSPAAQV